MYVCDTNNHCVRRVYYDMGQVDTPTIKGVPSCSQGECKPIMENEILTEQEEQELQANKEH